mgnify:CR=1 FL=1
MEREPPARSSLPHPRRGAAWLARQGAKDRAALLVTLAPYLIGTAVLVAVPALLSLVIAFTRYDALGAPVWVGLDNFRALGEDPLFWTAVRNSLVFVLLAVPLRVLGALALALLLQRPGRGVGLFRMAVFFPTVVPDVAYALIWL